MLESFVRDVRFGLRRLRQDRVVTAAAVTTLALAIGACTAAFSLIEALILRPLPVRQPEQLVQLGIALSTQAHPFGESFSHPVFSRLRQAGGREIDLFAARHYPARSRVVLPGAGGEIDLVRTQHISGNAFDVLGVTPAAGRLLTEADDRHPGEQPVAAVSYSFWTRRLGGDSSVLGRWMTIDGQPFQIVGVARQGFTGIEPGHPVDIWVPTMMYEPRALADGGANWLRILGRLRPPAAAEQVRSRLAATFTQLRRELSAGFPAGDSRERIEQFINTPLLMRSAANGPSRLRGDFERPLWILALIVSLILLIAGSNVANLFLARAAAREREMSLRVSLGAGHPRLVRQVLLETAILSAAACALGLLFATATTPAVVGMLAPATDPAALDLQINWRVVAFLGALAMLTTLLFGLLPAWRASAAAPADVLKTGARASVRRGALRPLVLVQAAFAVAVLYVAGLLVLSFGRLATEDPGFDQSRMAIMRFAYELDDPQRVHRTGQQLLEQVRSMPGVSAASLSGWAFFSGTGWNASVRLPGGQTGAFRPLGHRISPGFFASMGMRLVEGRDFSQRDAERGIHAPSIVNQAFARHYFGESRIVGRTFERLAGADVARHEIVGVVADAKYGSLREPPTPIFYVPLHGLGVLHLRSAGEIGPAAAAVRQTVEASFPSLKVRDVSLQSTLVENSVRRERLLALLSGFFALIGLALAAVGIYGVLTYAVVQRTREIGIRIALGAARTGVVRAIAVETATLTGAGAAAGLAAGIYLARFVTTILYEVEPLDVVSVALPIVALIGAGTLAAALPARRAAAVDPLVALRHD